MGNKAKVSAQIYANKWQPTDEQREMVRAMSGYGTPAADIARVVDSEASEAEFLAACADDIEQGQIQASAKLQEQLYTQAVNGNTAALLHLSRQQMGSTLSAYATTAEMCSWSCITKVALHDLRKRGIVDMAGKDRWNVKATMQSLMRHYRDVAAGRKSGGKDADAPDLVVERALLARAQREDCEMKNEVTRGNLIDAEEVRDEINRIVTIVVRSISTVADRLERDRRVAPEVSEYVDGVMSALRDEIAGAVAG